MKRIQIITGGFLVFALILFCRLFYLQVTSGEELALKADLQKFYDVELMETTRGSILDCNDAPITSEDESLSLLIVPFLVDDPAVFTHKVCDSFDLSYEKLFARLINTNDQGDELRSTPFVIKSDLNSSEIEKVEKMGERGIYVISIKNRYVRDFPAQHLVGSLEMDYENQSEKGASGLEMIYDKVLSTKNSRTMRYLIDEKNNLIDRNGSYADENSAEKVGCVKTTIDLDLQRMVESALNEYSGSVVILDSKNGDVLALASSYKYDPFYVSDLKCDDVYVNKSFSAFPPASLFKIFISAVALEEGIVAPESSFFCDGSYYLENDLCVSCWEKDGHGFLTFDDSLAFSCNPVFVKTSLELGASKIKRAFENWELDQDELLGYPLNDLSDIQISEKIDTSVANACLGESGVLMTPLNVAKMINVIAGDGVLYTPRIVTEVYDSNGMIKEKIHRSSPKRVISKKTADIVTGMMVKTFQIGTAKHLNLDEFGIAGKTGTSETGNVWIGGFFPYESPQYTIAILVSGGTSGVKDCGPIMKKICAYLGNR